jgi:hypothetical protein
MLRVCQSAKRTYVSASVADEQLSVADVQLSHVTENSRHRPKLERKDSPFPDVHDEAYFDLLHPLTSSYSSYICIVSLTEI